MPPEVAVLYHDLSVRRVGWQDKETLPRDGVQAVAIVYSGVEKRNRRQALIEYDNYVLVWTDDWQCLTPYDDGDFVFFSLTEPWKPHKQGYVFKFPFNVLLKRRRAKRVGPAGLRHTHGALPRRIQDVERHVVFVSPCLRAVCPVPGRWRGRSA